MQRDEGQVAARRRDQRGQQHPAREVVLVGDLEREHRAGRGRLEDRGDARGRARDEQHAPVLCREEARQATMQTIAEGRTAVERRALESHRASAAERRDRGEHPRDERTQAELVLRVVEREQVLVGGRR